MAEKDRKRESRSEGPAGWVLVEGDCLEVLPLLKGMARLIFADPPYNIGVDYGCGKQEDALPDGEYIAWASRWIGACRESLTPDGTLWVLINSRYAAEYAMIIKRAGLHIRSWNIWYETFGRNMMNNFNQCARHLFYCVRDPKKFVFNRDAVRKPSARLLKYRDRRAAPEGKLWDNVWGIDPPIPRLVKNARERIPGAPNQLPLALLLPIVLSTSEPGDLVLDPFCGTGTTGVAALRNGRCFAGIDKSHASCERALQRLSEFENGWRCDASKFRSPRNP